MAQTIKLKRSGTQGAAPTTSNLALGEVAINTYDGRMYIKKDVGGTESIVEIGGSGSVSYLEAGMIEYEYTATSNQTTFSGSDNNSATLSYTANSVLVFLNGVLQDDGVDYTATNGTSVVFGSALTANDEVRIVAFTNVTTTSSLQNPTKLDAISTVNNQAAYSLTLASSAYTPSSQNALIVSLNGITQEPGDSFTISGSTITFSPALVTGDVVDYIVDMGRAVTIGEYDSDLVVTGDITPGADSTYDLGASGTEWANVYADTFTGNLTGNVTGTVSSLSNHDTDDLSEGSTNLYFTTAQVDSHLSGGTGVTYNAGEISIGQDVSTTATPTFGNITTTGYIAGPSTFTIDPAAVGDNTGTLVVAGNLQVDGTTTTINSTTMTVDDLNITLASGAANAAAANGAGITVDGASATLTYNSTPDAWSFNKNLGIGTASPDTSLHLYGSTPILTMEHVAGNSSRIYFEDATDGNWGAINANYGASGATKTITLATASGTGDGRFGGFTAGTDECAVGGVFKATDLHVYGNVGVGTNNPDGKLNVFSASAGSVSADADADELVLENSGNVGLSLLTAGTGESGIYFGNPGTNGQKDFYLKFYHESHATTANRRAFTFNTASTERMRIDSAGNVGIGTSSPDQLLDVGDHTAVGNRSIRISQRTGTGGQTYGGLEFFFNNTAGTTGVNAAIKYASGPLRNDGELTFHTGASASISERLRIDHNGNVGIGTSSPVTRLEVEGSNSELIRISSSSGNSGSVVGTGSLGLDYFSGTTNPAVLLSAHEDSSATYLSEFSISLRASNADVAPTERMRIDNIGNIGIAGAAQSFGAGVATLQLKGLSSSQATRAGALRFISNNGTSCDTAIYSDNGFMSFYTGTSTSQNLNLQIDAYGGLNIKSVAGTQAATFGGSNLVNGITALPSSAGVPFVVGRDTGSTKSATFAGHVNINTGYGLSFDGGSNYLDDYEEGTWEPQLIGSTANPSVTYHTDTGGKYVKIGHLVYVTGTIRTTAISGGSGSLWIVNIPFGCATRSNGDNSDGVGIAQTNIWNGTSTEVPTFIKCKHNDSAFYVGRGSDTAVTNFLDVSDWGSTCMMTFTLVYHTN